MREYAYSTKVEKQKDYFWETNQFRKARVIYKHISVLYRYFINSSVAYVSTPIYLSYVKKCERITLLHVCIEYHLWKNE